MPPQKVVLILRHWHDVMGCLHVWCSQRRLLKKWSSFYDTGASHLDVSLPVIQFPCPVLNLQRCLLKKWSSFYDTGASHLDVSLPRRLLKKWSSFYDTGASYLDVFLPVIQFPWLVLNNVTAIPPNRPLARYQLLTVADLHADPAHYTQFHVIVVSLPETYVHASKLPYLHPDIPGTACQACGHGLAFCRPSELSLPATRALFKQGHKLSTACSLVSVFPWDGSTQLANAIHVPVQYQHYTEYYEHAFCAPNAMCLPSFRRHLCLIKDSFGFTDQPRQAKVLALACRALHQI
ncbi:hypothetical protein DUNSADRAFT_4697 [Dunaliella salina]|uniref:Encoded protein n=1 Tax=Dunaliella salina TaxID=3046 RepID=A0ABQ7H7I4_DUNSA|nr:hypothetical protein DUNSADRAFT_4697 [Dunaliella salina]|eukprot:KAF5842813.1 hypothetical protein DUNSADRAFT_4697 [Dunaliella salina]